jgi:hypothetical protein
MKCVFHQGRPSARSFGLSQNVFHCFPFAGSSDGSRVTDTVVGSIIEHNSSIATRQPLVMQWPKARLLTSTSLEFPP